jgi:pilin isopeptide linkage protein
MKRFQWKNMILILAFCSMLYIPVFANNTPVIVSIPITNETYLDDTDTYLFEIIPSDEHNPMPEQQTVTIEGAGSSQFGPIEYYHPGDYNYTIKEARDENNEFVYCVLVHVVTDDTGYLKAAVSVNEEGRDDKGDSIQFDSSGLNDPAHLNNEEDTTAEPSETSGTEPEKNETPTVSPSETGTTEATQNTTQGTAETTQGVTETTQTTALVPILGLDDMGTKVAIGLAGLSVLLVILAIVFRSGAKKEE